MKVILMWIRPQHLANILKGKKTIELRKRFPKDFRGWVYLYCTKTKPYLADFGDNEYPYKSGGYECSFDLSNIERHDAKVLNGKVVCRFWVDKVDTIIRSGMGYYVEGQDRAYTNRLANQSSLTFYDLQKRFGDNNFKAIHISKLEIFDKPKELGEFYKPLCEYYQDGICIRNANKMGCEDSKKDINPDGSVNVYQCNKPKKSITIAPQSWQYIYIEEEK